MYITAKFNSQCAETGKPIKKGEMIYWIRSLKKVYCKDSDMYRNNNKALDYIQDPGEVYFDNWASNNL